jgi:hypothetical protein
VHWDWVCDRLSRRQLVTLRRCTARHLDIVNTERTRRGSPPPSNEGEAHEPIAARVLAWRTAAVRASMS